MRSDVPEEHSYAWTLSYSHELTETLSVSFSWLNEGHIPAHHRDGHAVQLWARTAAFVPGLALAAGIGPYRYFDTTVAEDGGAYSDSHGWGIITSLAATWHATGPWLYQLRLNRVATTHSLDTTTLIAGVGYRLQPDSSASFSGAASGDRSTARRNELTLLAGQSIVNSLESENSATYSVELRHRFGPVLRASVAWLDEGEDRVARRNGAVLQAWLEPSYFENRFTVGLGLGAYIAVDENRPGEREARTSGIITVTTSYRLGDNWVGRFSSSRIVTNYDRDADILLLGIGYRF